MKFFELKSGKLYKDVFDLNGSFEEAYETKLTMDGVERITVGQYKPKTLRITISNDNNLKTIYILNKKQIIIKILNLKTTKPIKKPIKTTANSKYNISSVKVEGNAIVVDFTNNISKKDLKFFEVKSSNLQKDVFDLNGAFEDAYETKLNMSGVDRITVSQYKPKTLRFTISGKSNPKTIYIINKKQIIIKVLDIKQTSTSTNIPTAQTTSKRKRVIVIDPGHGGKDVGAVGSNKKYEKVVVLNVSKYLSSILKARGYTVHLTRTNDRFIKLQNRTKFSNDKNADIFISIHTNAIVKSKANKMQGIETFFLSPARSDRAKRVAALENEGDMDAMSSNSQNTFLTVLNQSKITESNKLAIDIQQNLLYSARQNYKDIVDGGVREGPFWVLVGAQMPSVLVELGYISHPTESKRLMLEKYQRKLAEGLANGVDSYFSKNPY